MFWRIEGKSIIIAGAGRVVAELLLLLLWLLLLLPLVLLRLIQTVHGHGQQKTD